ncbi:hypothetical protein [Roseateles microcysteis]|uniref:hypothetical protein n=1 Tax=Roseateles microcysteis TaxID=3119057 RepID=UPI002FE66141
MPLRRIEEVTLEQPWRLLVRPELVGDEGYELIYRSANGLRWDPGQKVFYASEPERWAHAELLQHLVRTLADEFGTTLQVTSSTRWVNTSGELLAELGASVSGGAPDV